jgi:hypothetical protein
VNPMDQISGVDSFFFGHPLSQEIFEVVRAAAEGLDGVTLRPGNSQIAFRRRTAFGWVWRPGQYLKGRTAPLVLTLALRQRHPSPRWKEIVEPAPGRFTHHLELFKPADFDSEAYNWLKEAWEAAA